MTDSMTETGTQARRSTRLLLALLLATALAVAVWFGNRPATPESAAMSAAESADAPDERTNTSVTGDRAAGTADVAVSAGMTPADVAALRAKAQRVDELALARSGLTAEQRRQLRTVIYANFYDPAGAAAHRQALYAQLVETFGAEEADFRLSIMDAAGDWAAIKNLVRAREQQLGSAGAYNRLLLEAGLGSGDITAEEIASLVNAGTELPQDAVYQIASQGNVETIAELADRGLLVDPNYEHPTLSMNAIGAYVRHASAYPENLDPATARESVLKLISLGVDPASTNGTFDALDYALQNANNTNLDVKIAMIGALLERGIRPQASHYEALQLIANEAVREELNNLLHGYSG